MRDPLSDPERGRSSEAPEEEEEEWEEEEEEEEEEEDEEEEDEEEEEEEEKAAKPPEAKKEEKASAKAEPKAKEKKAPAKPKEPADYLKIGRILFVAGISLFFLATCAHKSHGHWKLKYDALQTYYQGQSNKPVPPPEPYKKQSVKLDAKERNEEQEEFNEEYQEAVEKYTESEAFKDYLEEKEEWNRWVHEHQTDLAEAGRSLADAKDDVGNWAMTRFYAAHLGILMMLAGLILFFFHGDKYDKIAALLVLGLGLLPLLSGGLGHWMSVGGM